MLSVVLLNFKSECNCYVVVPCTEWLQITTGLPLLYQCKVFVLDSSATKNLKLLTISLLVISPICFEISSSGLNGSMPAAHQTSLPLLQNLSRREDKGRDLNQSYWGRQAYFQTNSVISIIFNQFNVARIGYYYSKQCMYASLAFFIQLSSLQFLSPLCVWALNVLF